MGVADHDSSAVRCGAWVRCGARVMYRVEESGLVFHVDLQNGCKAANIFGGRFGGRRQVWWTEAGLVAGGRFGRREVGWVLVSIWRETGLQQVLRYNLTCH
jgi:hypothetical protein